MQEEKEIQGKIKKVGGLMEVKKVFEEGTVSKYLVKGTNYAFMNVIRRTIMNSTPCLAVDTVQFYENDSPIADEMLANRLGLLPIKTDVKAYKTGNNVKLVLEKAGPGNVVSGDIKSADPKIEIADKNILITKLGKGKKIKLEMNAVMDVGERHAKYQPAIVSYNEVPSINNDKKYSNVKEIIADFPKGTIEEKGGKLVLSDPYNTKIRSQHQDLMEKHGIEIDYSDSDFVLTVETTGQLDVKEIIASAAGALTEKLGEFAKEVGKL
jgi:DNA-directed RNA polymerase subunit D